MSLDNTFRKIGLEVSTENTEMVDQILTDAPILEMIPMEATTHGDYTVYEELESVDGAEIVDLDDELPEMNVQTKLKHVNLGLLGGKMYIGEDKAKRLGGRAAYFAKKQPTILKKTGVDTEKALIYKDFRAFAIANDPKLTGEHCFDAKGTGSANYSILAIKWVPGETTGLYNEDGFGKGMLMDIKPINGGELFDHVVDLGNGRSKKILSYGIRMKSQFGLLLANPEHVASIVNIDIEDDKLPTESQMDNIIDAVKGSQGGSTWLFMHPKVRTALYTYKASRLTTDVKVDNLNRTFNAWNNIPMLTSYNFKRGTEARVLATA